MATKYADRGTRYAMDRECTPLFWGRWLTFLLFDAKVCDGALLWWKPSMPMFPGRA
jgi:hypothetical protein